MKKRKFKLSERKSKDFFLSAEMVFQICLGFVFHLFGIFAVLIELSNFDRDTFGLTNYGFAIMLGLSSISFSWARNLDDSKNEIRKWLNGTGRKALYGAIVFLMGSALKYVTICEDCKFSTTYFTEWPWMIYVPKVMAFFCFLLATIQFTNVISDLLKIIARSEDEEWEDEIKKREKNKENKLSQKPEQ